MSRRTTCTGCGDNRLTRIMDLGFIPVADAYTDIVMKHAERFPLDVAVCPSCWLVQLLEVLPQEQLFGTGYSFYTSASPPLSAYHRMYADDIISAVDDDCMKFAVEIGCNDGDLLRHLRGAGWRTLGVDPAGGPVKVAQERGLDVINEPFGAEVAHQVRREHGSADVIVANHVLAHVEDVSDVMYGIAHLLGGDGVAYVEVQYLPDMLVNNAFDLIYHEHRNFFSLSSLQRVVRRHHLMITDVTLTERQGGSLRVTLRHNDGMSMFRNVESLYDSEYRFRRIETYTGLQARVDRIRSRLRRLIQDERAAGRRVIGYGAPAKATTLLNFCDLAEQLELIVDTTPAKQGRYVPGTGIKIVSPESVTLGENDTVIILAWNYAGTIMRNHPNFIGRWLLPIPAPMII